MIQFQDQDQPFSAGAPLWIIADQKHSAWAKKLDWYLNFQLRKAKFHKSVQLSEKIKQKMQDWGFDLPVLEKPASPLMIASHKLLPNELTVQIASGENWASECLRVLKNLRIDKARIFLPSEMTPQEFKNGIGKKSSDLDLTFEFVTESSLEDQSV